MGCRNLDWGQDTYFYCLFIPRAKGWDGGRTVCRSGIWERDLSGGFHFQ